MGVVLIVIEHLFESVEVEAISDVLLVHFAEELVVFEVAEPADPSVWLFWAVGLCFWHVWLHLKILIKQFNPIIIPNISAG